MMNMTGLGITAGVVLLSYLIGSVPFGYVIGKCHGRDIRKEGSGNIGATNVTRVIGKWWGKLCFLLDFLKGALCVFGAEQLIRFFPEDCGSFSSVLPALAVFAVVAGHIWPIYLRFRGGKGISTAAGALLGLSWPAVLAALIVWVIVFEIGKYVSLASILAAIVLPFAAWFFSRLGIHPVSGVSLGLMIVLSVLAVVKHRSNIVRLLNGTENRFGGKSK